MGVRERSVGGAGGNRVDQLLCSRLDSAQLSPFVEAARALGLIKKMIRKPIGVVEHNKSCLPKS